MIKVIIRYYISDLVRVPLHALESIHLESRNVKVISVAQSALYQKQYLELKCISKKLAVRIFWLIALEGKKSNIHSHFRSFKVFNSELSFQRGTTFDYTFFSSRAINQNVRTANFF